MGLVPEDIGVHGHTSHNVNININTNGLPNQIGKSVESVIITLAVASVLRSWFRRK